MPKPEVSEVKPKVVEAPPPPKPVTTTYEITWYTAGVESTGKSPGDNGFGITSSGTKATEGRTIACGKDLPFGTRVQIEGVGARTCEDRGGAIGTNRIDIYVESVNEALQHGRQKVEVEILNEGKR